MIGVSGCGKSTYANKLRQVICSTDRFIDTYAKVTGVDYKESFDNIQFLGLFGELNGRFNDDINCAILDNVDFIIDRTNLTIGGRKQLISRVRSIAEKYGRTIIIRGVSFNIDRKTILDRLIQREKQDGKIIPQDIMNKQFESYQTPTINEGFDVLEQIHV
jgi:tRNA uridine 5-carbamoylmethylation protein Kti12